MRLERRISIRISMRDIKTNLHRCKRTWKKEEACLHHLPLSKQDYSQPSPNRSQLIQRRPFRESILSSLKIFCWSLSSSFRSRVSSATRSRTISSSHIPVSNKYQSRSLRKCSSSTASQIRNPSSWQDILSSPKIRCRYNMMSREVQLRGTSLPA